MEVVLANASAAQKHPWGHPTSTSIHIGKDIVEIRQKQQQSRRSDCCQQHSSRSRRARMTRQFPDFGWGALYGRKRENKERERSNKSSGFLSPRFPMSIMYRRSGSRRNGLFLLLRSPSARSKALIAADGIIEKAHGLTGQERDRLTDSRISARGPWNARYLSP